MSEVWAAFNRIKNAVENQVGDHADRDLELVESILKKHEAGEESCANA